MKLKSKVIHSIIAVTQLQWIQSALMTLAILVGAIGVTGCASHH